MAGVPRVDCHGVALNHLGDRLATPRQDDTGSVHKKIGWPIGVVKDFSAGSSWRHAHHGLLIHHGVQLEPQKGPVRHYHLVWWNHSCTLQILEGVGCKT